jgi:hypothetical protein
MVEDGVPEKIPMRVQWLELESIYQKGDNW